jgi:FlaA1/EpsC-like NDP-sugar epimerase
VFNQFIMPILGMPRPVKRIIVFGVDAFLCIFTIWLAYYLRMGYWVSLRGEPMVAVLSSLALALPIFAVSGLYRVIFRHSGWPTLLAALKAVALYGFFYAIFIAAMGFQGVPRTIGLIQPVLLMIAIGISRVVASHWLGDSYRQQLRIGSLPRVLIYGAGSAGRELSAALRNSRQMRVVGFLDDDHSLQGQVLNNIPIYDPSDLPNLVSTLAISDVLLALPSLGRKNRNEILKRISQSKVSVQTLPSITELASGKVKTADLRDLDIEDLLGREPVAPDMSLLAKNIENKVVLVTGAGGSIGSELCRQALKCHPTTLVLVEQNEFALYAMQQDLQKQLESQPGLATQVISILASVRNSDLIEQIFVTWKPHIVFHAAAYKHVPLVEENIAEGIENNVFGTLVCAKLAEKLSVPYFVLISTDKAVRPTNVMGATKRIAEMILQAISFDGEDNRQSTRTIFSMVRFGNVLDSSGSVVPLFRQQIRDGGPITLTHPEVTRYFMTIPEAAQLVLQASAMASGGDVFVLDMGESVKIIDLARHMIELSGLEVLDEDNPAGDIEIAITGLRPGEKLYEELLIGDNPVTTTHPRILKAHEEFSSLAELEEQLRELKLAIGQDADQVKMVLRSLVRGYQPDIKK